MSSRRATILWILLALCTPAWTKVFVHSTGASLPPAKALGLYDLVVPLDRADSPLLKSARQQGYRIYFEASLSQLSSAVQMAARDGVAGLILNARRADREKALESISKLRSSHPKLKFLLLSPDGKQPEMRGSLVIKRGAVLEVSSPTAQPWIDTNLALVRIEQRENPEQVPLYTFSWKASESGQPQAPTATDYSLAIAEAGAFHADMILNLDDTLQKALSENDAKAWALWNQVKPYVAFSSHASAYGGREPVANVAIVVGSFDSADEPMNLLARHNIPFKVFQLADLKSSGLENFDVVVVFAKPDQELCARLAASAGNGNIVVLIDTHGSYSWQTAESVRLNEHAVSYTVGSGRVIELSEPVIDPETFAQDIRRLLGKQKLSMSLWNALTTLAVPSGEHGRIRKMELVNYAADPLRLQVRVKGSFTSIRYETPEHGCCIVVAGEQRDGFTEFVVPDLRIAGRVRLEDSSSARHRR